MHTLTIVPDIFNLSSWKTVKTDNICATLLNRFEHFPDTARIYHKNVSVENDITPKNQADVDTLEKLSGTFWVVVYPGTGVEELVYIAYALIAVVAIVAITNRPKIPNSTSRNYQSSSPNNDLSQRTNTARVNSRIPDIYGTVRSTPDLLAVPYSVFNNNIEFEYCYMCVGRGSYDISADTVRDGQTVSSKIEGESVEIFGPNTSPNTGDSPQLRIGDAITRLVISAVRSKSVNGQVLVGPNESSSSVLYANLVSFEYPNRITAITGNPVTFAGVYTAGDTIVITTPTVVGGSNAAGIALFNGNQTFFPSAVPRNVKFHTDGSLEFDAGFLATLYDTYLVSSGDSGDTFASGVGPGHYVEITSAVINIGGTDYDFSGKYLSSHDSGDFMYLVNASDCNSSWSHLTGSEAAVSVTFANTSILRVNFTGTYDVFSIADKLMTVDNPANYLNAGSWLWASTGELNFNGGDSSYGSDGDTVTIGIGFADSGWVGPFVLDVTTTTQVIANYVALNGMYADDGTSQTEVDVTIQLGATPCLSDGTATGPESYFTVTIFGSDTVQSTRAATLFADLATPGRYMIRSRRLTPKNLTFSGTVVDEVKWRDVYSSSPVGSIAFGDVTTVHAVTQATQAALAISERQINMLVTRKLPAYNSGTNTFGTTLVATNNAADIISAICLDPKIGKRQFSEVNFPQIYTTLAAVVSYFGISLAGEFSYTFDSDNLSFEEMISTISQVVFCTAHRRGRVIELLFERQTSDSVLLFNHRNKLPGSEQRTTSFGAINNNDGIEYDYVDPSDDAVVTFYVPIDRTAVNPKKLQSVGVRSTEQAHLHAFREYNRLRYQTRAVSFDATQESELISTGSRILITDNTRPDVQDGEIVDQNGLLVQLSQPATILAGAEYVIFLQLKSGIVEMIDISAGADSYHAVLSTAPSEELVVDDSSSVKTLYQIVKSVDADKVNNRGFLLTEKTPQSNFVNTLTAVNYDDRYYANDLDFF